MKLPRRIAQGEIASAPDPALAVAGSTTAGITLVAQGAQRVYQEYQERREQAQYVTSFHSAVAETEAALTIWDQKVTEAGRFMQNDAGEEKPTHELLLESYDKLDTELRDQARQYTENLSPENARQIDLKVDEILRSRRQNAMRKKESLFLDHMIASLDDTTHMYIQAGDYYAATQMVADYHEAGTITADERRRRVEGLYKELIGSLDQKVTGIYEAAQTGDEAAFARLNAEVADTVEEAQNNRAYPMPESDAKAILEAAMNQSVAGIALARFETAGDKAEFVASFNDNRPDGMTVEAHQAIAQRLDTMLQRSQRLEAEATAEADAVTAKEQARQASDLEIAVSRGEASEQDIEAMFEAEIITPAKRTQLYRMLDDQLADAQTEADGMRLVSLALTKGVPMDAGLKEDRDAVSAYYDRLIVDGLDPLTAEGAAQTAFVIRQTGVVPESFQSLVRRGVRSSAPAEAAQVADAVRQVQETAPALLDQLDADERAFALEVSQMVAGGADPETAVTTVREGFRRPKAEQDLLKSRFSGPEMMSDNRRRLEDFIDGPFDTLFSFQPDTPDALEAEFNANTQSYYMRTGNIESARQLAWEDLQRVWGVSEVNGRRELMKYPPEYAGGTRAQFEADTAELEGDIRAVADAVTARDGGSTYALMQAEPNGMVSPVMDEQGRVARWRPEHKLDPEVEAEIADRLSEAQAARERLQVRRNRRRRSQGQIRGD